MRKGSKTSTPFLVKMHLYVDVWATATGHVAVELRLHDDDT
jgi:hypothetical protein